MQQRVDERVLLVAGGGMHDESGGLVDDEQGFVLEQNIERDFFPAAPWRVWRPANGLQSFRPPRGWLRGLDGFAVDADVAFFDQPLQRAARGGWKFFAQKFIEPRGRQRFLNGELFGAFGHPQIARMFADSFRREPVESAEKRFFILKLRQVSACVRFSR